MPGVPLSPGFIRPDPKPHPDLPNLKKSGIQVLNDGREFRYSTITDYVDHLIAGGYVKDVADLIENHSHLIAEIFFRWISSVFSASLRNPGTKASSNSGFKDDER